MAKRHDQEFVERYAKIIYWQGIYLNGKAVLFAGIYAFSILVASFSLFLFLSYADEDGLYELGLSAGTFNPLYLALNAISNTIQSNVAVFLIPLVTLAFSLAKARFAFLHHKAQAQMFLASSEVATNTSNGTPRTDLIEFNQFERALMWFPSVAYVVAWTVTFGIFFAAPSPLEVKAVYPLRDSNSAVVRFSSSLANFDDVNVSVFFEAEGNDAIKSSEIFFSTSKPECNSNLVLVHITEGLEYAIGQRTKRLFRRTAPIDMFPVVHLRDTVNFRPLRESLTLQTMQMLDEFAHISRKLQNSDSSIIFVEGKQSTEDESKQLSLIEDYLKGVGLDSENFRFQRMGYRRSYGPQYERKSSYFEFEVTTPAPRNGWKEVLVFGGDGRDQGYEKFVDYNNNTITPKVGDLSELSLKYQTAIVETATIARENTRTTSHIAELLGDRFSEYSDVKLIEDFPGICQVRLHVDVELESG